MKIWITRLTTGELHSGGLQRCRVWFVKPTFVYYDTRPVHKQADEIPWGINPLEGLGRWGWRTTVHGGTEVKEGVDFSFGDTFGYGDRPTHPNYIPGFAAYVWDKLCEHYGNTEFPHGWYEYEKSGKCRQEDFLLEINLEINFNQSV